ncbi:anti-sigma factor antagonist [Nocardia fluminea]
MNTHSGNGDRPSRGDDSVSTLRAEVTLHHTATVLHVHGEIDACNLPQWRAVLDEAITAEGESGHLVIDIRDVTFMSCRAILDLATRAQRSEVRMSVVNPVPSVTDRIIVAAGLTEWLPVYPSRTAAMAAARLLAQATRTIPPASWTTR